MRGLIYLIFYPEVAQVPSVPFLFCIFLIQTTFKNIVFSYFCPLLTATFKGSIKCVHTTEKPEHLILKCNCLKSHFKVQLNITF